MPVVLVVLTCTVFYHALKEWEKNGGVQPEMQKAETNEASGRREGERGYNFNRLHDGGWFYPQLIVVVPL